MEGVHKENCSITVDIAVTNKGKKQMALDLDYKTKEVVYKLP